MCVCVCVCILCVRVCVCVCEVKIGMIEELKTVERVPVKICEISWNK